MSGAEIEWKGGRYVASGRTAIRWIAGDLAESARL